MEFLMWKKLLASRLQKKPLEFITGVRAPIAHPFYCPKHAHPLLEIVYHVQGEGTTTVPGRSVAFVEGSIVIYAPKVPHDQTSKGIGSDLCILIKLSPQLYRDLPDYLYIPRIESAWLIEEIRELSKNETVPGEVEQSILNLRATAVLLELLHLSSHTNDAKSPIGEIHVRKAEAYICRDFADIVSLADVSENIGVSQDHLRHLFRTLRGKTVIQYVNEVRIERVKSLLVYSNLPLKQIAEMCGFKDKCYFSVIFRKHVELSPGAYRKAAAS